MEKNGEGFRVYGRVREGSPIQAKLARLRAVGIAMIALPLLAAAGTVGYGVAQWRGNSEAARCVAINANAPLTERVQAMVGMQRDLDLSIALIRQLADEPGEIGAQARNAMHHLRDRVR